MESAIPEHLQTARTRHRRVGDDYAPPYPSFVARHKPSVTRVVMAYFGIQSRGAPPAAAEQALARLASDFESEDGPTHWDRASYVDEAGFTNVVTVAYWDDRQKFDRWFPAARERWTGEQRTSNGFGTFIEALCPSVEGYETLFSSLGRPEGVAVHADGMSGEVLEHAYWGGMRDRIPLSQTSEMAPSGSARAIRDGARIRIVPHDNLCLIRSGQDWGDTEAAERKMYLGDVEPVLREGMDFLRDQGRSIGCYANRYMTVVGPDGAATEKSYGMSWWKSLSALERWAESHPTHVRIFGAAMKYLSTLGPAAKLRLYHEVTVARADEQLFEYELAVLRLQPCLPDLGAASPMHRGCGGDHRRPFLGAADEIGLAFDRGGALGICRQVDDGRRSPDRIRKRHHRAAVNRIPERAEIRPHQHFRHHPVHSGLCEGHALQFGKRHLHRLDLFERRHWSSGGSMICHTRA